MAWLLIMISCTATRPLLLLGSSICDITAASETESIFRTCSCSDPSKVSTILLMVCTAELVCSVPKTRCPVSAAVSAASIVSLSRISPMRMISGSSRIANLSAVAKLLVSSPTFLCEKSAFLFWWINSTGSSTVIICLCSVRLISLSSAERVVDLPLPVGPVTRMSPFSRLMISLKTAGAPRSSREGISVGIILKAAASSVPMV